MMNRATQNWPEGMVLEINEEQTSVAVRAPYAHELDANGMKCGLECPACKWVQSNSEVR